MATSLATPMPAARSPRHRGPRRYWVNALGFALLVLSLPFALIVLMAQAPEAAAWPVAVAGLGLALYFPAILRIERAEAGQR